MFDGNSDIWTGSSNHATSTRIAFANTLTLGKKERCLNKLAL